MFQLTLFQQILLFTWIARCMQDGKGVASMATQITCSGVNRIKPHPGHIDECLDKKRYYNLVEKNTEILDHQKPLSRCEFVQLVSVRCDSPSCDRRMNNHATIGFLNNCFDVPYWTRWKAVWTISDGVGWLQLQGSF